MWNRHCGAHILMIQTVHHKFYPLLQNTLEFYFNRDDPYWSKIRRYVTIVDDIHDEKFRSSTCEPHNGAQVFGTVEAPISDITLIFVRNISWQRYMYHIWNLFFHGNGFRTKNLCSNPVLYISFFIFFLTSYVLQVNISLWSTPIGKIRTIFTHLDKDRPFSFSFFFR